jgi:hypothetical protein
MEKEKKFRFEVVLRAIHEARAQLATHPDVFQATEILKTAEAELAALISEMFPEDETAI